MIITVQINLINENDLLIYNNKNNIFRVSYLTVLYKIKIYIIMLKGIVFNWTYEAIVELLTKNETVFNTRATEKKE